MELNTIWDKLYEECGVFGTVMSNENIPLDIYYGLFALQHRGQESAGMTLSDGQEMKTYAAKGLVTEVFSSLSTHPVQFGIGHVRYSTTGANTARNVQPIQVEIDKGSFSLAHNGNLTNAPELREYLIKTGSTFETTMDTEVLVKLVARSTADTIEEKLIDAVSYVKGAYCLVAMSKDTVFALRDSLGIRPLCLGKTDSGWVVASESCALDAVGAKLVRDIAPGEMVIIDKNEMRSRHFTSSKTERSKAVCAFEFVYLARPDSVIDGQSVYEARLNMGARLWEESQYDGDAVMSVPDSGTVAAIGYANASGIPYMEGFIKNRYMGRTFILPSQKMREQAVKMKLNPIVTNVRGKRIILIDDSIVRGTTSGIIIKLLKDAGAKEVTLCISSPPVVYPNYYGIDISKPGELIATTHTTEEIRTFIGADRLHFLSQAGLAQSIENIPTQDLDFSCFDGNYPTEIPKIKGDKYAFE